jgi:16S rRNA (adenine1518-N6/adenine1519-N6)-dimethyltransferase
MDPVRPKKHLGQHFLHDQSIADRIVASLLNKEVRTILEIGPGTGVLTKRLLNLKEKEIWAVDLDKESINFLKENLDLPHERIIYGDFLKLNIPALLPQKFIIIGNLPYNISSQIFFRLLAMKDQVPEMVCMIQKEVADRIVSPPGNKTYGILSVLLQAFFDIEYLFTVKPGAFNPPPKVNSAVIRLTRNKTVSLPCDQALFTRVVKQGFQNRRKTLRNALKPLNLPEHLNQEPILSQRAEQLNVADFVQLTQKIEA